MLQTRRQKHTRGKKGFGPCMVYTPESVALVNAALDSGATNTDEAIARANTKPAPAWEARILRKKRALETFYDWRALREYCYERRIAGRSKLRTKADMIRALLYDMFLPVNVEAVLQAHPVDTTRGDEQ